MQECLLLAGQQSCWDKFNGNTIRQGGLHKCYGFISMHASVWVRVVLWDKLRQIVRPFFSLILNRL